MNAFRENLQAYVVANESKATEIGELPDDWSAHWISDLIADGSIVDHLDGNHGELYPRSHEFSEFGIPYVTANDLVGRHADLSKCKRLPQERARTFQKGVAKSGDVLFAHNATVGPCSLLRTKLDYVILSTTVTYFRCNNEKLLNEYLLYALQSPGFVPQYEAIMSQSTRNQVPITAQRKLLLAVPPTLAEQEAIASALGDADALIESLEQLLAKKRQIKQGAMQELLTGDWPKKSLDDLFTFSGGISASRKELGDAGHLYLHYGDIHGSARTHIDVERDLSSIPRIDIPINSVSRASILDDGDVVFVDASEDVEGASKHVVIDNPRHRLFISGLHTIVAKQKAGDLLPRYLRYCFQTPDIAEQFRFYAVGTKVSGISKTSIKKIELRIPDPDRQIEIANTLDLLEREIESLFVRLDKAQRLKQAMMQQLLTGRIRLV